MARQPAAASDRLSGQQRAFRCGWKMSASWAPALDALVGGRRQPDERHRFLHPAIPRRCWRRPRQRPWPMPGPRPRPMPRRRVSTWGRSCRSAKATMSAAARLHGAPDGARRQGRAGGDGRGKRHRQGLHRLGNPLKRPISGDGKPLFRSLDRAFRRPAAGPHPPGTFPARLCPRPGRA